MFLDVSKEEILAIGRANALNMNSANVLGISVYFFTAAHYRKKEKFWSGYSSLQWIYNDDLPRAFEKYCLEYNFQKTRVGDLF